MTTIGIAFLMAFIVAVIATRILIRLAWPLGLVDIPDGYRKLHAQATPRLGGPAIYLAFLAPLLGLIIFRNLSTVADLVLANRLKLTGLMVGATLTLILGLADDKFNIRPFWKLLSQAIIGVIMFGFGYHIYVISNPLGNPFSLGIFALPVTLFWFVACMNAVNLLDGLDGLAAGMTLFVSATLFLVGMQIKNILGMFMMACLGGATFGFLLFNFPPARIFLGDSGSLLLGFLIASLSLIGTARKAEAAVALLIPIVALGLPILDTSVALLRRWYKRLPLSMPDRQHIHHVLVTMGFSQRRAVLTLYIICVALGGAALAITFARSEVVLLVIGALILIGFVTIRIFSGVRFADVLDKLTRNEKSMDRLLDVHRQVERALADLSKARDGKEAWHVCTEAFKSLGFYAATLNWNDGKSGAETAETWTNPIQSSDSDADGQDAYLMRLSLYEGDRRAGDVLVEMAASNDPLYWEHPELLRRLCDKLMEQLTRAPASQAG